MRWSQYDTFVTLSVSPVISPLICHVIILIIYSALILDVKA